MKYLTLDIFLGERFYGTLRVRNLWGGGISYNRARNRLRGRKKASIFERKEIHNFTINTMP